MADPVFERFKRLDALDVWADTILSDGLDRTFGTKPTCCPQTLEDRAGLQAFCSDLLCRLRNTVRQQKRDKRAIKP